MAQLLPDTWKLMEEEPGCCHQRRSQRRGPITDILIWIECYTSMVSVLATRYPSKTSQLMSHQKTIIKAHRTFTGEGWVTYDVCFRRKAAITKSLDWGEIDFTLNETFTGRAKLISRCQHCSSDMRKSQECAYAPTTPSLNQDLAQPRSSSNQFQVCQLFNGRKSNRCYFNPCKYAHVCSDCQGRYPVSASHRSRLSPVRTYPRKEFLAHWQRK